MTNDIQQWAQALLEFPNLVFAVVDTTSVKKDADIIRLLTLDKHGFTINSMRVYSVRHPDSPNTEWTGITQEEMRQARTLQESWTDIREALRGQFVLAYGFDFLQERLYENAQFYGLKPVHMIGDCLMQTAVPYFRPAGFTGYNLKLQSACARIGYILPDRPLAKQRAEGQLALLKAMAEGRATPPTSAQSNDDGDELGDLDSAIF